MVLDFSINRRIQSHSAGGSPRIFRSCEVDRGTGVPLSPGLQRDLRVDEATAPANNADSDEHAETTDGVLTQYFYDANGNTIEKDVDGTVTSFAYDDQNRMITATTPDHVIHYEYDADGIRTEKTVDTETTVYLVDHQTAYPQVLEERTDSGSLIAAYTIGNDLISMRRGGVDSYYHYDGLGSTRELTDSAGLVTDTYDYEAFGEKIASTGSTQNAFLFTGEQYDPGVGFYYLRARYMVPRIGRFTNMDTWVGNMEVPLTLNKYLFANASPVMFIDPSGYFSLIEISITLSIRSILSEIQVSIGTDFLLGVSNVAVDAGVMSSSSTLLIIGASILAGSVIAMSASAATRATKGISWTAHGGKHVASRKMPWRQVILSTKNGPAKYKPSIDIETIERAIWAQGKSTTNGRTWKVMEFAEEIGASGGATSRWVRVEKSAGTIHGHPITQAEYRRLTR